jgi:predicted RNA binding protein YcfA (HicA-like mRNA interferase family)
VREGFSFPDRVSRFSGCASQNRGAASSLNVTVPGKPGDEMAVGTLNNILKQAGLKP